MKLSTIKATKNFSNKISKNVRNGDTILLYGEIGVGKTTFVRFLINHLEIKNGLKKSNILSPTFNIVYDYNIGKTQIEHYDLFRLKNYKDILELGIFENIKSNIKIIEWPELIKRKPKNRIEILFKYSNLVNSREAKIVGFGRWKDFRFNEN